MGRRPPRRKSRADGRDHGKALQRRHPPSPFLAEQLARETSRRLTFGRRAEPSMVLKLCRSRSSGAAGSTMKQADAPSILALGPRCGRTRSEKSGPGRREMDGSFSRRSGRSPSHRAAPSSQRSAKGRSASPFFGPGQRPDRLCLRTMCRGSAPAFLLVGPRLFNQAADNHKTVSTNGSDGPGNRPNSLHDDSWSRAGPPPRPARPSSDNARAPASQARANASHCLRLNPVLAGEDLAAGIKVILVRAAGVARLIATALALSVSLISIRSLFSCRCLQTEQRALGDDVCAGISFEARRRC